MARRIDAVLGNLLAAWVERVRRRAPWVIGIGLLVSAASLLYAAGHLGVNADSEKLFDDSLHFRQLQDELDREFPLLTEVALVVIDAPSRFEAEAAARILVERLEGEGETFASVYAPGIDPFFERNGLLYLSTEELEELADHLAAAQPFLAELSRDRSLRGLFDLLATIIERAPGAQEGGLDLSEVLDGVRSAVRDAARLRVSPQVFAELILGGAGGGLGPGATSRSSPVSTSASSLRGAVSFYDSGRSLRSSAGTRRTGSARASPVIGSCRPRSSTRCRGRRRWRASLPFSWSH